MRIKGKQMLIGYARVSTNDQNLDSQRDELEAAGCERVYQEVASGAKRDRPELERMLEALRPSDVVVVARLDRIGRSLPHLVELVERFRAQEVGFRVLTGEIDTTTSAGRLVFHIFAAVAEFERSLIRERTMAGLKAARARGRTGGRPAKMTPTKVRMAGTLMADPSNAPKEVADQLGVSVSTLYRYVDGFGRLTARGENAARSQG
jgi:DNA invertase Pin-like site-specific DNA recombinase